MKTNLKPRPALAFTLIEMVGVLAVIALLSGILVPKVLAAIDNARIEHTISSLNAVKSATMGYFNKYGRFGEIGGGLLTTSGTNWDRVLVAENFLARPFDSRVGERPQIQVMRITETPSPGVDGCFTLTAKNEDKLRSGSVVVLATLANVSLSDARELSWRIDGDALSATDPTRADALGRVTYPAGGGTVAMYINHQ